MKDLLTIILDEKSISNNNINYTKNVAMVYKIQKDTLIRLKNFANFEGYILGISDEDFFVNKNLKKVLSDIIFEYKKYKFKHIFLEFKGEAHSQFVYELDELCYKEKIKLYVPFCYARVVKYANLVINTAISGGNLKNIFEYSIMQYGLDRISAEISFIAREFDIPSQDSIGRDIDFPKNANEYSVFFSDTLYTNYFTQMREQDTCVFTIFDNKYSFEKKIQLIGKLNVKDIFINCKFIEKTLF